MTTETKHTPEPWELVGAARIWKTGKIGGAVAIIAEPECADSSDFTEVKLGSPRWNEAISNARRIVACVNACAGMLDAELEGANFRAFTDNRFVLEQERDELAEALRMQDQAENGPWDGDEQKRYLEQAKAARVAALDKASPDDLSEFLRLSEIYKALAEIGWRIERCGASEALTYAVTLTSDLRQAIGNSYNPADKYAAERVRAALAKVPSWPA